MDTTLQSPSDNNSSIFFTSALAALAGLLFGYDTGVISGAILFIRSEFELGSGTTEAIVSAVLLGALIGSACGGRLADYFGRRTVLLVVSIIFILGSLITAYAPHPSSLITGRAALGLAIGVSSFTAPLYLAEIAPSQIRGMLVTLNQLAITIGIVLAYGVDFAFAPDSAWRWMLGLGVVPAAILFIGLLFLPESPRWMVLHGRTHQARKILEKLRGTIDVSAELREIEDSAKTVDNSWRLVFAQWSRPVLIIGLGLAFFQQTTGINTIIYYAPTILQMAGFHQATGAILATLGVGIMNVLFTIIAMPLLDRIGRRPLLIGGLIGMFISLICLGLVFYSANPESLRWLAVGSMLLYVASFAMSLGPILWLMIAEIFPLEIRGTGASVAAAACWAFNLIVAATFLTLVNVMGASGTFWLYAVLSIAGLIFVYKFVPETTGCSLEKIERNLRLGKHARHLAD